MKLLTIKQKTSKRDQEIVVLKRDVSKEEFTDWRQENGLDDRIRVYREIYSKKSAQNIVRKQNQRLFDVVYGLAESVARQIPGGYKAYMSSKPLRQQLGLATKRTNNAVQPDLLDKENRNITRLSYIIPGFSGAEGASMMESIFGQYLQREMHNGGHIVPTKNLPNPYAVGLQFRSYLFAQSKTDLEVNITADKANHLFDDFIASTPWAKDIMQIQMYSPDAVKNYRFIEFP